MATYENPNRSRKIILPQAECYDMNESDVHLANKTGEEEGNIISIACPAIPVSHLITSLSLVIIGVLLFVLGIAREIEREVTGKPMLYMSAILLVPGCIYVYELHKALKIRSNLDF